MTRCTAAVVLGLALGATGLQAQARQRPADDSARVYRLEPIEVTVTRQTQPLVRVPAAISAVGAAAIQRAKPTISLDESLALVPGVQVSNRYNFTLGPRITIRGFGSRAAFGVRGIRIIEDGIPLTMPDGQAKVNALDLGSAGRIQVIRGPSSALFGNAAGGVISVETEAPPPTPLAGQARLTVGNYGDGTSLDNMRKLEAKLGGQSGRASYFASLSRLMIDGFRANSREESTVFNGNASFALDSASSLRLILNAIRQPVAENPGSLPLDSARTNPRMAWPTYVTTHAGENSTQFQGGVGYSRRIGGDDALDVTVYGLRRKVDNPLTYAFIHIDRGAGGVRSTYTARGQLGAMAMSLITGVDVEAESDARHEYDNDAGEPGVGVHADERDNVSAIGPFAEGRVTLRPDLELTLGARFDAVRFSTTDHLLTDGDDSGARTLHAWSPKVGLLYAASPAANLYATVATSFQTPTTTELINRPPAPGEGCCQSGFNQQLDPERALSYEAGVKGVVAGRVRYDVAAFTMNVRDEIVPFRVPEVPDRDFYRNAGRSRHRGLELSLDASLTPHLDLGAAYTYSDFVFVDDGLPDENDEGNRLPGIAPHHFAGRAAVHGAGLFAELQGEYVSSFFTSDDNTADAVNAPYAVFALRFEADRSFGPARVAPFFGIENLFDRRYNGSVVVNATGNRYYEPAPGRHVYLGVTVPLGGW